MNKAIFATLGLFALALLLIVGSVTVAGLLLYQLVANPWAIVGFAAAIVILLVLLIALS